MLSDVDYAKEVDTLNRFYASFLTLADEPSFRRLRDVEAAIAPLYEPLRETMLAVFLVPAEEAAISAVRRCETRLRGTQCLVCALALATSAREYPARS